MIQLNHKINQKRPAGLNHYSMLVISSSLLLNLRLQSTY